MILSRLIAGVALVQLGLAVPALLLGTVDRVVPAPTMVVVVLLVAFAGIALLLLRSAEADDRAVDLGTAFMTVVGAFAVGPTIALAEGATGALAVGATVAASVRVDAFLPHYLWRFVSAFPKVSLRGRSTELGRRATLATLILGGGIASLNVLVSLARLGRPREGLGEASWYWPVLILAALPALLVMVRRYRFADRTEQRRVRILLFGAAAGAGPILVFSLLDGLGLIPARVPWALDAWIVYPPLLAVPFLTAYAVLVDRALDVRLILRRAMQYALARYTLQAGAALAPLALVVFLFSNRDLPVSALFVGPEAIVLSALAVAAAVTLRLRERFEAALDRRFFREQYDARQVLTALVEIARGARTVDVLTRELVQHVERALHPERVVVLCGRPDDGWLVSTQGGVQPLSRAGPFLAHLARTGSRATLAGGKQGPASPLEARWLADHEVELVAAFVAASGEVLGLLGVGPKRSELPYTPEDRTMLSAVASAASVSLQKLVPTTTTSRDGSAPEAGPRDDDHAWECTDCSAVQPNEERGCRVCGAQTRPAAVPALLHGKFRIISCLGAGGFGRVYLAEDGHLGRGVALKTLPIPSPQGIALLQREARAAATVSHPNLAIIHGMELWRGTPILVFEHLALGSLASTLRVGPLPPKRAIEVVRQVATALAHLHERGLLHRDVKPSNVAFAEDGTAKLLDFGLVDMLESVWGPAEVLAGTDGPSGESVAGPVPGTIPYMSPEALSGYAARPRDDLWALGVLACEAFTGTNPFRGRTLASTIARVIQGRPEWPPPSAFADPRIEALLHRWLAADATERPQSAHECLSGLARLEG